MDAFELLKNDHEQVSRLFKEIESVSDQAKKDLFAQLKTELDLHAHIEETIFYPALEKTPEAREITLEAYEEHKVVKDLLAELASPNTPNDEWNAKLTVLRENVEHHVEEEEGELFDRAEDALTQEDIDRLGNEMAAEKAKARQGATGTTETAGAAEKPATATNASKADRKTGILSTLANLVGLGSSSSEETKRSKSRSSTRKSTAAKQKPAKKAGTKKARATKTAAKKAGVRKAGAKKVVAKKAGARKVGVKKVGAKKAGARKAGARKAGARKAGAKKAGAKKAGTAKSATTKARARRASRKSASGSGNRKAALNRRSAALKVSRSSGNKKRKATAGTKRKRSR